MTNDEMEERSHRRRQATEKLAQERVRFVSNSIKAAVISLLFFIGAGAWGCPQYRVYNRGMSGQANLRQQEFEKLIRIEDARAQLASATLFAQAEVERARGVAEANQIIGDSLQNNEAYLRYLWIQGLHDSDKDNVIYVPTEANLPILEASRFQQLRRRQRQDGEE